MKFGEVRCVVRCRVDRGSHLGRSIVHVKIEKFTVELNVGYPMSI